MSLKMLHAAVTLAERTRIARINRAYLQTALALHRAGHSSWLLSRFDLSAEMLEDLAQLSPEALDSLHADMNTTLFSVEADGAALECLQQADPIVGADWIDRAESVVAPGNWLITTVLQELAVSNVHSDSAAYRFNCEQSLADALTQAHPLLLASLAAHGSTRLCARFTRSHVMAADVAGAFPVGLLMSLH